jgi:hypothetical protein
MLGPATYYNKILINTNGVTKANKRLTGLTER